MRIEMASDTWQCILTEPTFGDEAYLAEQRARKDIDLYGWPAVQEVIPRFMAILGPDAVCQQEDDFCETSHCPPGNLEAWLASEWNQHHAGRVARMEETAGAFPLLLIRGRRGWQYYRVEIWSPKDTSNAPNSHELKLVQ